MKKFLIINPFGIGDVLFTTPVIHSLKSAFPEAKIGYLCNSRSYPVLKNNPYIESFFIYERDEFDRIRKRSFFTWVRKNLEFIGQIRKGRFDTAIDFSLNTQYGFFSWFAGIKERIGYDYKGRGSFLTKKIAFSGYSDKHIVEYYAKVLKQLGVDLKYRTPKLYLNEADLKKADEILKKENIVSGDFIAAIIPGGGKSWGKDSYLKHWPPENFAGLADKIIEKYQAKIIIMGDSSERELARSVIKNMQRAGVNLAGLTTLEESIALLSKADLVVANDGGPLHLAVALNKKTVSFFGPVDPKVYGPYPADEKKHIVLRKVMECSPCYRGFRLSPCLKNKECLQSIGVDEAFAAVEKLISGEKA